MSNKLTPERMAFIRGKREMCIEWGYEPELLDHIDALEAELSRLRLERDAAKSYYLHKDDNFYWTPQAWEEFQRLKAENAQLLKLVEASSKLADENAELRLEREAAIKSALVHDCSATKYFHAMKDLHIERDTLAAAVRGLSEALREIARGCNCEGLCECSTNMVIRAEDDLARHAAAIEASRKGVGNG